MTKTIEAKLYVFRQNISGGYLIQNEVVDLYVIVEAEDRKEAREIVNAICDDFSSYCSCCGERWELNRPYSVFKIDSNEELSTEILKLSGCHLARKVSVIVYMLDGSICRVELK